MGHCFPERSCVTIATPMLAKAQSQQRVFSLVRRVRAKFVIAPQAAKRHGEAARCADRRLIERYKE
jgi:hypothetical protein